MQKGFRKKSPYTYSNLYPLNLQKDSVRWRFACEIWSLVFSYSIINRSTLNYLHWAQPCTTNTSKYTRGLWKRITIFFVLFLQTIYAIEKLLAGCNVQPRIGMNQSLIWLHYHATLLMTSHGYIQHPAPFCTFKCLNCGEYDTISPKEFIDLF